MSMALIQLCPKPKKLVTKGLETISLTVKIKFAEFSSSEDNSQILFKNHLPF